MAEKHFTRVLAAVLLLGMASVGAQETTQKPDRAGIVTRGNMPEERNRMTPKESEGKM